MIDYTPSQAAIYLNEIAQLREQLADVERASREAWRFADDANASREKLRQALHDIAEEWAGAECGLPPVTAQEAYAIQLAQRMAHMASEAIR